MLELFGRLRLDKIGSRQVEAYKARRKQDGVGNKTIETGNLAADPPNSFDPWGCRESLSSGRSRRRGGA